MDKDSVAKELAEKARGWISQAQQNAGVSQSTPQASRRGHECWAATTSWLTMETRSMRAEVAFVFGIDDKNGFCCEAQTDDIDGFPHNGRQLSINAESPNEGEIAKFVNDEIAERARVWRQKIGQ